MVYRQKKGRLGSSAPPVAQGFSVPASVGGINSLDSYASMPPQDCIYTYNLMPVEYGLQLRKGYRTYASGLGADVRTLIAYESNTTLPINDRLFAVTENGIYDITTDGTTSPTAEVSFATQNDRAGYGTWMEFTNDASNHYLFYADYTNGVWQYTEGGGWARPTGWTYDPGGGSVAVPYDDIAFIMVHKLRIWVIFENSDDAWYLPVAAISGELTKFSFGAKMKYGGNLQGLWSWTLDGGDGVDDYLVAVSRGGDTLVYRGGDPEASGPGTTPWALNGNWFIGRTPDSRRIASQFGADMFVLSTFGITSMRDLLQGTPADLTRTSASAKINRILRGRLDQSKFNPEWSMFIHPADGFMQIISPFNSSLPSIQYNRNLNTNAWGMWEGVEIVCAETYNGDYYMGATSAASGEVWIYEGNLDGVANDNTGGTAISFRVLTSFQAMGAAQNFKNVGLVRVIGRLTAETEVNLTAVYDYDIEASILDPANPGGENQVLWDTAVWDDATWTYDIEPYYFIRGSYDIGRTIAVGMRGSSKARIEVVSWDISLQTGGWM